MRWQTTLCLFLFAHTVTSFHLPHRHSYTISTMSSTSSSTPTPPTTDQFDKTPPPSSFYILTQQSTTAITSALAQSHTLLEVEFPPLPSSVLEMDDVSAYDVSRANIKLASETATELIKMHGFSNIAIMVPDEAELDIARESTLTSLFKGVTINALRNNNNNNNNDAKPANEFMKLFAGAFGAKGDVSERSEAKRSEAKRRVSEAKRASLEERLIKKNKLLEFNQSNL